MEELLALVSERPLVFFDLETTGTDRFTDRIVEVSAMRLEPGGGYSILEERVNPGIRIPRESTAIHGISDADVKDSPRFAEVIPSLEIFLSGADLAGYNIRTFDVPVLQKEYERAGNELRLEGRRIIDAQVIFFRKEPRDLSSALRFFAGREHKNAHSSLADVIAAAEVLAGELRRYTDLPRDIKKLAEFSSPVEGRFVDPDKRFLWRDGEAVFAFGEHRGITLRDIAKSSPGYLEWMANRDFPAETKRIVREALRGVFPEKA
jgi:DNA polymerase-3 subunit epsilon